MRRLAGPGSMLSREGLLTAAAFGVVFLAFGVHLPFWPVWLSDHGLSPEQIGSFTAISVVVRMASGLGIPLVAERLGHARAVLTVLVLLGAVVFSAFSLARGPEALLALTILTALVFAGIVPLVESLGVAAAQRHGFAYAGPRGLGSLAFLAANLIGGVMVGAWGSGVALWLIVGALLLSAPVTRLHPGGGRVDPARRAGFGAVRLLARHPAFLLLAGAAALVQGSHAVLYVLGSVHWRDLGISDARIGALWAVGVAAEVVLMVFFGDRLVRRLGPVGALVISGGFSVLRWLLMCLDPVGWWLWPLQAGHCVSFALGHLGTMAFFQRAVPASLGASAQGVAIQLFGGIAMAGTMFAAGQAYPVLGGRVYAIAALVALCGVVLALWLGRVWRGGALRIEGAT